MKTKSILDLDTSFVIAQGAHALAKQNGWNVAISIVDDGGHSLLEMRTDETAPISSYIAHSKAKTAAIARRETVLFEDEINGGRTAFLSVPVEGLLEGGVPIIQGGSIIGAIGIAGVKPSQSAAVAKAGIDAWNNGN